MIDPIRDPAYHDYQKKKLSKKVSGSNTEKGKFNLDYAEEGVLYEPSSDKEKEASGAEKKQTDSFQAAAARELHELTETEASTTPKPAAAQSTFTDTLRAFFVRARQMLRRLWSTIWESTPAKESSIVSDDELQSAKDGDAVQASADSTADGNVIGTDRITADGPESAAGTNKMTADAAAHTADGADTKSGVQDVLHAGNDARILHALKSGDRQNFRSLLSEDGKRIPARNSSLLTYYDAKGNLISPDASVQQRVLHGDRGSMKR